jgi:GDPmannose 4,6-dehydratase
VPCALVTGIGGQDGSLLAELLLERGYRVVGTVRDLSAPYENLAAIRDRLELVELDLARLDAVEEALRSWEADEIYNLASVSLVPLSWEDPLGSATLGVQGVTSLLEGVRRVNPAIRLLQATSSEIFGQPRESPQSETTPVAPVSPYGAVKAYGHFLVGAYRRRYGLHACSAILFNHESPRRPESFVTRKVARAAARISAGLEHELRIGSLEPQRDWGYAGDTVRAMWLALAAAEPDDYVVATGEPHSVQDLVELAFAHVGLVWRDHVVVDEELVRGSSEIWQQVGDASRARDRLGWEPTVTFPELVRLLVDAELEILAMDTTDGHEMH